MTNKELDILVNIIGGVESGGQIYGKRRYDAYAGPYKNSPTEHTVTLGWCQFYGYKARELCQRIYNKDKNLFLKNDTANIKSRLSQDWVAKRWNPSSSEKSALINIISSTVGKEVQDEMFKEDMLTFIKDAESLGVTNVGAQMMYCEIRHLGGKSPTERIFKRATKPYTADTIYSSLLLDQKDTSNNNQVGDKKYQSRHQKCVEWIHKYVDTNDKKGADASVPSNNTLVQKVIDDAVTFAVSIANDNSHGYSQAVRSLYNISNPKSFDCSSLVCTAYYYAFTKNGLTKQANYLKSNCSYTGNMLNMLNCGFEVVATNQTAHSKMVKGDVELNVTHHTALAIDSNNIVHARSSEGTSNTTDDSGNEIRTQGWYLYSRGWTHRLRFTGKGITASGVSSNTSNGASNVSGGGSTSTLLRKGSKGQAVKELQEKLNKLGYGLTVDGDFGSKTESAVISFQKKYNLEVDGVVGNETRNALDSAIKALTAKPTQPQSDSWVGEVNVSAGSTLAVRTWAGTEYPKIKSYPELGRGNRVRVLGSLKAIDGSTWYKIAINNAKTNNKDIIGFVSSKYIKKVQ